ncbi:ABC transporter permease [Acidocella sp.]|uniref:ABC transporter permease n=1 Tax=Acidocella sp. TaxID=50710 RepID=UPI003CFD74D7
MSAELNIFDGRIVMRGALTARELGPLWERAVRASAAAAGARLILDLSAVQRLDSSGAALLLEMERRHGGEVDIAGADDAARSLLAQLRAVARPPEPSPVSPRGKTAGLPGFIKNWRTRIAFFGETLLSFIALPANLRLLRRSDFAAIADRAGMRALFLVLALGYLIGMILAFQSAVPMRQFGADLYVADLVTIALCRELGPLLVAVILAGRTGSAYAAELGTMRVNDEISALVTMGINPTVMLVLPRIAAAMLVMPALTVAMDASGLAGMASVLAAFGYPLSAITSHIAILTAPGDFLQGLAKGVVFAAAVALIGCRAGLTASGGPRAVGQAATAAVVGGIVATVVLDGLFAIILYRLHL